MKRLISLSLTIATLLSVLVVPITANAKVTKPKKHTYYVSGCVQKNYTGTVYATDNGLYFKKNSRKVQLDDALSHYAKDEEEIPNIFYSFYMKDDTVYYSLEYKGIFSVKNDGTKQKKISEYAGEMLGGYGSTVLTVEKKRNKDGIYGIVKANKDGESQDLLNLGKNPPLLFNGKIYYGNKVYNLDTKKISTFSWKNPQPKAGKDYFFSQKEYSDERCLKITLTHMYYINKNNNLVCMDKLGNKRVIAKGVSYVLGCNTNKNVVYVKKNSKGIQTIYRQNSKGKNIALTNYKTIYKKFKKQLWYDNIDSVAFDGALLANGKVVLYNALDILCVDNTGGKVTFIGQCVDEVFDCVEACGATLYYRIGYCDDIPFCLIKTASLD